MPDYLATLLAGLEPVAADELAVRVPDASVHEVGRARVRFRSDAPREALLALRSVDNLFLDLGTFVVGPHRADLAALGSAAAELVTPDVAPDAAPVTLWVNASRVGRHTYSRFAAAQAVMDAVARRYPRWRLGTEAEHSVELRLDVEHDRARLGVRLTPAAFRFRGQARAFAAAALRPPVAHALVWLTAPRGHDVFLDPFCGSGTIVFERAAYPARRIVGSDVDGAALAAARENARDTGVELHAWDARRVALDARSVDAIATNLPFGRQVLDVASLPSLYLDFAREAQRVLVRGGVAIVLTEQAGALDRAVEKTRLRLERVLTLSLKGLHPEVLRLTAS